MELNRFLRICGNSASQSDLSCGLFENRHLNRNCHGLATLFTSFSPCSASIAGLPDSWSTWIKAHMFVITVILQKRRQSPVISKLCRMPRVAVHWVCSRCNLGWSSSSGIFYLTRVLLLDSKDMLHHLRIDIHPSDGAAHMDAAYPAIPCASRSVVILVQTSSVSRATLGTPLPLLPLVSFGSQAPWHLHVNWNG